MPIIRLASTALLLCTLTLLLPSPARAAPPRIESALEDASHRLVLRFAEDAERFPAGNSVFWGTGTELFQLELTSRDVTPEASVFSFLVDADRSGSLVLGESEGTVSCPGTSRPLRPLTEGTRRELEKAIASGKTRLHFLPQIWEPLYFFEVQGAPGRAKEYVLIEEPRFNHHDNYRLSLGPAGRWKPLSLKRKAPGEGKVGVFSFEKGGGVYVPMAIDLFTGHDKPRGSPTLIRGADAAVELLARPRLSRTELRRLGIRPAPRSILQTPCKALTAPAPSH